MSGVRNFETISFKLICVYIALAALALLGVQQTLFQAFVREQYTDASVVNHQCYSSIDQHHYQSTNELELPLSALQQLCQPLPSAQSIKRFVMFATDCWPVGEAGDVLDHFKDHAVAYAIDIPGAKYSHAIWTSYLTGQLPTNYKGDPIQGDHFIKA
jgi:hypothetical protein